MALALPWPGQFFRFIVAFGRILKAGFYRPRSMPQNKKASFAGFALALAEQENTLLAKQVGGK